MSFHLKRICPSRSLTLNFLFFLIALGVLWFQARHALWRPHLQADVVTFHSRAMHFLQQGSWANLGYNEYQPSALWFFVLVGWLTPYAENFDHFLWGVMTANVFLMFFHYFFFLKYRTLGAAGAFSLLLLAMGPILFFRFELLVTALALVFWKFYFQDKHLLLASICLGLAVSLKIYPVVFLPLIWIDLLREHKWREWLESNTYFLIATFFPVMLWIVLGGSWTETFRALEFHKLKPIGLDGLWGTLAVLWGALTQQPYQFVGEYGISGLRLKEIAYSDTVLNWIWVVPMGILYRYFSRLNHHTFERGGFLFLLMISFLLFTKVMNPQYLWWAFSLLPLLATHNLKPFKSSFWLVIGMSALLLALTQLIYPIYYSEYLAEFQTHHLSTLFGISLLRNILLIGVWVGSLMYYIKLRSAWPKRSAQ